MRRAAAATILLVAVTSLIAACTGSEPTATTAPPDVNTTEAPIIVTDNDLSLPERDGPRRETTGSVPHIQLDAVLDRELDAELRRRVFQLPDVEDLPSDRSLPGARGLALSPGLDLARPDVIAGSREFAHIHPDGSLHVWLSVAAAQEVDDKKWGELHPWADRDGFWDGVVMVFTPETMGEVEVTVEIVVDAYNFVTGASLTPSDIP